MAVADGFHVDTTGNLWLGSNRETFDATTRSEAPFYVYANGDLVANSGTFSGDISGASGTFTGDLTGADITGGTINIGSGTFQVDSSGNLTATSATITGSVTATSGTIGGISINSSDIQANYSAGTSGFKIDTNGDAEFNEVTIRVKGNSSDPSPSGVSDNFISLGDSFIYDFLGDLTLMGDSIRIRSTDETANTPSLTFYQNYDNPGFYGDDSTIGSAKLYWSNGNTNILHSDSTVDRLYIDASSISVGGQLGQANQFIGKDGSGNLGWHTVSGSSHPDSDHTSFLDQTDGDNRYVRLTNQSAHSHNYISQSTADGRYVQLTQHSHSGFLTSPSDVISVTSVSSGGFVNSLSYNSSSKTLTVGGSNTRLASITTRGYGVQSSGQNVGNGGIGVTLFYTSLNSVSDETLKTGITDLTYGLDWINDLRPISYRYDTRTVYVCETEDCEFNGTEYLLSTDECDGCDNAPVSTEVSWGNTKENWGFSAQEIEATLPTDPDLEIVEDTEFVDGSTKKVLDYNQVIAPLVKAVQELSAKNDELESRIAALEG